MGQARVNNDMGNLVRLLKLSYPLTKLDNWPDKLERKTTENVHVSRYAQLIKTGPCDLWTQPQDDEI